MKSWLKWGLAVAAMGGMLILVMILYPRLRVDNLMAGTQRVLGSKPVWEIPREVMLAGPAPSAGVSRHLRCEGWSPSRGEAGQGDDPSSKSARLFSDPYHGNADVHFDGQTYRMWFTTAPTTPAYSGETSAIHMAMSFDGLTWRNDNQEAPVLAPGSPEDFDSAQVGGVSVIRDGTLWKMWYTGLRSPDLFHRYDKRYQVGMATSHDGVHWTKVNGGRPVLTLGQKGEFDETQVMFPTVIKEPQGYRMWYAASSEKLPHSIGMATSVDGLHWNKAEAPVEGLGFWVTGPSVAKVGDQYVMVYVREDLNVNAWHLAAAMSLDGFHWYPLNGGRPICGTEAAPESETVPWSTDHPSSLIQRDGRLYFWVHTDHRKIGRAPLAMATLVLEP